MYKRQEFLTDTKGEGIMASVFECYAPYKGEVSRRSSGSLVSFETGESVTYGLFNAQERGVLFIGAGVPVYAGMVVGLSLIHISPKPPQKKCAGWPEAAMSRSAAACSVRERNCV